MNGNPFDNNFLGINSIWVSSLILWVRHAGILIQVPDSTNYPVTSLIVSLVLSSCPIILVLFNYINNRKAINKFFSEGFSGFKNLFKKNEKNN